jgi:hypothetical protein
LQVFFHLLERLALIFSFAGGSITLSTRALASSNSILQSFLASYSFPAKSDIDPDIAL